MRSRCGLILATLALTAAPAGAAVPTVTSISPASGPPEGGTQVTITGSNLDTAGTIVFGTVQAITFYVDSPMQLRVIAPPGASGTAVVIHVTGPDGTSQAGTARFRYVDKVAPVLSALSVRSRTVRYELTEPATTTFRVRTPSGRLRATFRQDGAGGANRVGLRRSLKPGRYVLVATPRDATGNTGKAHSIRFTIRPR